VRKAGHHEEAAGAAVLLPLQHRGGRDPLTVTDPSLASEPSAAISPLPIPVGSPARG